MELPFLKKNQAAAVREYFFALEIDQSTVKSAVWSVVNDKTQVLAVGATASWDGRAVESLVAAADETVSDAVNHLDPAGKIQPEKVIFGLPADWVDGDKILPEKLVWLKSLSQKLELKPVGFVVTPEAAIKFLKTSEGVPPTAILLGWWPEMLELSLVRLGKIVGTQTIKRSSQVVADVLEGLARFPGIDMLPSRILLYNSGIDLEEIKQLLLAHPWQAPQTRLPFLHFPKIEILPVDFTIRAIALAGGTEVAVATGLVVTAGEAAAEESELAASDLGFVAEADVAQPLSPAAPPRPPVRFPWPKIPPLPRLPRLSLPPLAITSKFFWPALLGTMVVVVGVGLGIAYWYLPKATVTLFIAPKVLQHQFDLTANTKLGNVEAAALAIPAQSLEVTVTGEKSAPTTGTKIVGDQATGTVTLYNGTDTPRKFAAGTTLSSPSGLKFLLDEEVAATSAAGAQPNVKPGEVKAKVIASQIGSDYNLSAGTEFRVGSFPPIQIAAKNDAAFSGGSSRQVKAVASADIASLRQALVGSLKDQAKDKLLQQVAGEQTVIAESLTLQTITEDFSHKLDEAADTVQLDLTIKARGLVVNKNDLASVVEQQVVPLIPAGYTYESDQTRTFTVKKVEKNSATFTVSVTAALLPQLDTQAVVAAIAGKSPDQAADYLRSLPGVAQIDILISPRLPASLATLPRLPKNISLTVQATE